jgi:hypothetical protein
VNHFFFLFFRRKETKEALCKQGRGMILIQRKPDRSLCFDYDMHVARTVFGQADAIGFIAMLYIKQTPPSDLSVPKQGPLAAPARVHVFLAGCVCTQIPGSAEEKQGP